MLSFVFSSFAVTFLSIISNMIKYGVVLILYHFIRFPILQLFFGGWFSTNMAIPWKEVETKLFALNVVSTAYTFVPVFVSFSVLLVHLYSSFPTSSNEKGGCIYLISVHVQI